MLDSKRPSPTTHGSGRPQPNARTWGRFGLPMAVLLFAAAATTGCGHSTADGGEAPASTATAAAPTDTAGGDVAATTAPPSGAPAPTAEQTASPTASSSSAASANPGASAAPAPDGSASAEAKTTERGAKRSDSAYSTWLEAHNPYQVGKAAAVSAVLVAGKGYKCNDKYPYKFKLDAAPAGLSYPETTVRGITYGKERSVLSVPFVPSSPGTHTISGTFSLSVCTEATCKIQKEKLSVAVRVEP